MHGPLPEPNELTMPTIGPELDTIAQRWQALQAELDASKQREAQLTEQLIAKVATITSMQAVIDDLEAKINAMVKPTTPPPAVVTTSAIKITAPVKCTANQVIDFSGQTIDVTGVAGTVWTVNGVRGVVIRNAKILATKAQDIARVLNGGQVMLENVSLIGEGQQCGNFLLSQGGDAVLKYCRWDMTDGYGVYAEKSGGIALIGCICTQGSFNQTVVRTMPGVKLYVSKCDLRATVKNTVDKFTVIRVHGDEGLIENSTLVGREWYGPQIDQNAKPGEFTKIVKRNNVTNIDGGIWLNHGLIDFVLDGGKVIAHNDLPEWGYVLEAKKADTIEKPYPNIKANGVTFEATRNDAITATGLFANCTLNGKQI